MKQRIFTLMILLALVVAGSKAFGQGKFAPYPGGGDYSYSIPYTLVNNGSATLAFDNGTDITLTVTAPANMTAIAAGSGSITFTANYAKGITAGTRYLTLTLTDGTSSCSNIITKSIVIQPEPTINLAITNSVASTCQTRNATPADNEANAYWPVGTPLVNTLTYTITPTLTNAPADFSYGYRIDVPTTGSNLGSYAVAYTGPGTATANTNYILISGITEANATDVGTLTVTFNTTTGQASETITAALSLGLLTLESGGTGTYTATYSGGLNASEIVNSVPTIGQFN